MHPLRDPVIRGLIYQILVVAGVLAVAAWLVSNTLGRLENQSISTGFGFLQRDAAFAISESLIDYSPKDSYLRALTVGLLNTFRVALVGILLATVLGTLLGVARLSRNWLLARLTGAYVEIVRNVPLLLQLFFWYALLREALPHPRQALNPLPGVFLSGRGLNLPAPQAEAGMIWVGVAMLAGIVATMLWNRRAARVQASSGRRPRVLPVGIGLILGVPLLLFALLGAPLQWDLPELRGFNFRGGLTLSPEFAALLLGLTLYTAAFIAEVVRAGIQSVGKGQHEAAAALGLRPGLAMRLVVLPQALRVVVPPLTSQYLNLTKNSSLAVAIGYPDLVSVANTTINQTGQAIEGIAIIMAAYLTISLAIAAFMNWYNRRTALPER